MLKTLPPLKTLPAFLSAAIHKSFSKAADKLHITQSALSQNIKKLENNLGCKLFNRNSKTISLTKDGASYFREINQALYLISQATIAQKRHDNTLTVNLTPPISFLRIIPYMHDFNTKHPDINLCLTTLGHKIKFENFGNNNIDLAIDYGKQFDWSNCFCQKINDDKLILIGGPNSASMKQQEISELLKHQKCIYIMDQRRKDHWNVWCKQMDLTPPTEKSRMYFQDTLQALAAVRKNLGITIISSSLIIDELRDKDFIKLSEKTVVVNNAFHFIYPKKSHNTKNITIFIEWALPLIQPQQKNLA